MASLPNPERPVKAKTEIHSQFLSLLQPASVIHHGLSHSDTGVSLEYICSSPSLWLQIVVQNTIIFHFYAFLQYSP